MKWSEDARKLLVISLILLVSLVMLDRLQPSLTTQLTGYAVYETKQLQWAFDSAADYDYNSSQISITNGEARLQLQKTLKELKNDTQLKLKQKNNGDYEKKLEFKSAAYKYTGAPKKLYIESEKPAETTVKLKIRTASTENGLEDAEWQPQKGNSYTEAEQDITGVQSGYLQYKATLETDDKKVTPILKSVKITHEQDEYPESATITTKEASFEKTVQLLALTTEEALNGQSIKYEYSTDSGGTWQIATSGQAITKNSAKIMLRATLSSNKTETPVAKDAKLSYKISICDEKWQANYTACGINDTKTKYYADANSCGSTEDLPADNGTKESCNYCTPQWTNTNGSCRSDDTIAVSYSYSNSCCQETGLQSDCTIPQNTTAACDYCTPLWQGTNSTCGKDDKITATFTDLNSCYAATGLQSDNNRPANKTYTCDYCTPSFACSNYGECGENDKKACTLVNDSNNCYNKTGLASDSYTGNYSEFATACTYDSEAPEVNSASATISSNTLSITANVTDKSPTSVTARLLKDGHALLNLTLQKTATDTYSATASATGLKGAYIIAIIAKDNRNNTQRTKGMAGVAAEAEKTAVSELALNSSRKAVLKLTNATRMELKGRTEATITGNIVLSEHREDIKNTTKPKRELKKYVEIEADETIKANISIATIILNYTDDDASSANISEATIALYYYNETASLWEQLNSTANTELNYVEGNTTHLSLFGLFGNAQNQTTNTSINQTINQTAPSNATNSTAPAANSTSNQTGEQQQQQSTTAATATTESGGGGAAGNTTTQKKTEPKAEAPKAVEEEKQACTYDVKVELEAKPSFINQSEVKARVTNTGNCELHNVEVKAAPPLDSYITIENGLAATLAPSESSGFTIKLKPAGTDAKGQPIQGFAVKEPRRIASRTGKIIITGRSAEGIEIEGGKSTVEEEIPLNIEIYEAEPTGAGNTLAALLIGALAAIGTFAAGYGLMRRKKGGKGDGYNGGGKNSESNEEKKAETSHETKQEDHAKFEENVKTFEEKHSQQKTEQQQTEQAQELSQEENKKV